MEDHQMAPEITSSAFTPLKKLKGGLAYRISTVGLSLQLLFSFAMIVSCVMQIDFLREIQMESFQFEEELNQAANANDTRHYGIQMIGFIIYVLTAIPILVWIYKAHQNVSDYKLQKTLTAGWAVGSFFVPFINLVRPYQAMVELYLCSSSPQEWHPEDASDFTKSVKISPKLTRLWWVAWTSCWFFGQALARWEPEDSVEWLQYTYWDIGYYTLDILLIVLFLLLMKNIQGNQKKNFLQNQSGPSEALMRH